jgi:8-oxo-dGTP pyrophosphatase MutT (NUDIX family)
MRVRAAALVIVDDQVLLVEFFDEQQGLHYVLPGGEVRSGETIRETVRRETMEEACIEIETGPLAFAYEYAPQRDPQRRALPPGLTLVFACRSFSGAARMPDCPDREQTGVRWIPLDELDSIVLSPPVHKPILDFAYHGKTTVDWIEEWK